MIHLASLFHGPRLSFCQWVLVLMSFGKRRGQCPCDDRVTSHKLGQESGGSRRSAAINIRNSGIEVVPATLKNAAASPIGNDDDAAIHPDLAAYWSSYWKRPLSELRHLPRVDFPIFPSVEIEEDRP